MSLDSLSISQLEALLSSESAFQEYFDAITHVQETKAMLSSIKKQNERIARETLQKQPTITTRQESLAALQKQTTELREQIRDLQKLIRSQVPDIEKQLMEAIDEDERQSEKYAEEWINDETIQLKEFMTTYRNLRQKTHIKLAKAEIYKSKQNKVMSATSDASENYQNNRNAPTYSRRQSNDRRSPSPTSPRLLNPPRSLPPGGYGMPLPTRQA